MKVITIGTNEDVASEIGLFTLGRTLPQTPSRLSNEQPKLNEMARVSFQTVLLRGFTPGVHPKSVCRKCATGPAEP